MRFSNWFNGASQVALFWTLFSTPFFWLFTPLADLSGLTIGDAETRGRITQIEETGASENERSVYAIHYSYVVDAERFEGKAYATGSLPSPDTLVTVYYDEGSPERSKLDGYRRSTFGWAAGFVIIFPAVGVVGLWFALRWGAKRNRLLMRGLVANGTLEKDEPTGATINDKPVRALTFGFQAQDGRKYSAIIKTSETKWLTDEDVEQILYDPEAPDKALALDELDPFPDFDEAGRLRGNLKRAAIRAILPAAALLANWFFVQRML